MAARYEGRPRLRSGYRHRDLLERAKAFATHAHATAPDIEKRPDIRDAFNPDEPRDPHGRWTSGGGDVPGGEWGTEGGKVVAFHGTTNEVAQSIIKNGIKINPSSRSFDKDLYEGPRGKSVYVANSMARAIDWAQRRNDIQETEGAYGTPSHSLVVFEVKIPREQRMSLIRPSRCRPAPSIFFRSGTSPCCPRSATSKHPA